MNSLITIRAAIGSVYRFAFAPCEVGRDFLAVMVEVLHAQVVAAPAQRLVHEGAAALDFLPAFLHGQLQVEDRLAAPTLGDPFRGEPRDLRWALHHVAHHPVDRLGGPEVETVFASMLHPAGAEASLVHRAIVYAD